MVLPHPETAVNRLWSFLFLLVPLGATGSVVLAALDLPPCTGLWVPRNQNLSETRIDTLMVTLHLAAAVVMMGTGLVLAGVIWRGTGGAAEKARYFSHHRGLEAVWTAVPAAILVWLAIAQYAAWRDSRLSRPVVLQGGEVREIPPTVLAVARRFGWDFHHAGADGRTGTSDDLVVENELRVPGDRDVVVELRSRDVIHSFCVPALRIKQDVVPGLRPLVWFRMAAGDQSEILCTELCGWGHYLMQARLKAVSGAEYDAWMQGAGPSAAGEATR